MFAGSSDMSISCTSYEALLGDEEREMSPTPQTTQYIHTSVTKDAHETGYVRNCLRYFVLIVIRGSHVLIMILLACTVLFYTVCATFTPCQDALQLQVAAMTELSKFGESRSMRWKMRWYDPQPIQIVSG